MMDWTEALTRLLSDPQTRHEFLEDRINWLERVAVDDGTHAALLRMDEQDLKEAARSLIDKRSHEVKKLAPRTWQAWGTQAAVEFEQYAAGHWPTGHDRHLRDALQFLEWLSSPATDQSKAFETESRWVAFLLSDETQWVGMARDRGRLYGYWFRRRPKWIRRQLRLWPL